MSGGNLDYKFPVEGAGLTIALPGGHELSVTVEMEGGKWEVQGTMPAAAQDLVEGRLPDSWEISAPRRNCYIKYVSDKDDLLEVVAEARAVLGELAELPPTGYWFQAEGDLISIDHWPGSDDEPTRLSFARIEPAPLVTYVADDAGNQTTAFITAVRADGMATEVEFADGEVLVTLTPDAADDILLAMSNFVVAYVSSK
jgi:hypothetical protein